LGGVGHLRDFCKKGLIVSDVFFRTLLNRKPVASVQTMVARGCVGGRPRILLPHLSRFLYACGAATMLVGGKTC
jgi:hypothetical protein